MNIKVVNRRDWRKKVPKYDVRLRTLADQYLVEKDTKSAWLTIQTLIGKDCIAQTHDFEKKNKNFHRVGHLKNGMKPLEIISMGCHSGHDIFVCSIVGSNEIIPVPAEQIYHHCMDLAIKFFQKRLKIKNGKATVGISWKSQNITKRVYNHFVKMNNPEADIQDDDDDEEISDLSSESDVDDGYGYFNYRDDDSEPKFMNDFGYYQYSKLLKVVPVDEPD